MQRGGKVSDWKSTKEWAESLGVTDRVADHRLRKLVAEGKAKKKIVRGEPYRHGNSLKRRTMAVWKVLE